MKKFLLIGFCVIFLSACNQSGRENVFYNEGLKSLENYQYSSALEQFKKAINDDNSLSEAYLQASEILISKGQYDEALSILMVGSEKAKSKQEIFERIAYIKYKTRSFDEALTNYEKSLINSQNYRPAVIGKINCLIVQNRLDEAKLFIDNLPQEAIDQELQIIKALLFFDNQEKAKELLNIAKSGANSRLSEAARKLLAEFEKLATEDTKLVALANIVFIDLENSWYEVSLPITDTMIKLNEYYEGGFIYRGTINLYLSNFDAALADFGKALQLNPNDASTKVLAGQAYFGLDRDEEAKAAFTSALDISADQVLIAKVISLLLDQGESQLAADYIDKYKTLNHEVTPQILLLELTADNGSNQVEQAYAVAAEILKIIESQDQSYQASAYTEVGFAFFRHGDKATGIEYIKKGQALNRSSAIAYYYEGEVLTDQADYENARTALERAIDLDLEGLISSKARKLLEQL